MILVDARGDALYRCCQNLVLGRRCGCDYSASKPYLSTTPNRRRLPGTKSVTIGVGIKCTDGIVLCADSQFTFQNSHKFYDTKIYNLHLDKRPGWVCFTFAGDPGLMDMFH